MTTCVFPGSFDPVTIGHLNLISRASRLFDQVSVTLMVNIHKKSAIPAEKRIELLKEACRPYGNVIVDSWDGLLADYMQKKKEHIVLRGLRGPAELENEIPSAAANKMLNDGIETVFLLTDPSLSGVSSSAVREIAAFGGDISAFVPQGLTEEITGLLSNDPA